MTTTVTRLSLCSCGFPLFEDDVKLGQQYDVDWSRKIPGSMLICGGCKTEIPSTFIWVHFRINEQGKLRMSGWLPMEAFDL